MRQRDQRVFLARMLEAAKEARAMLGQRSKAEFLADRTLRLALERLVQIVGEAARCVSPDVRSLHSTIPWAEIVGMRSKLVHEYAEVDPEEVWSVVAHDLPELILQLQRIVPPEP